MSQPDFRGKTKKDLSAIAHISGLLRPSDTARMTKQQLIDYLTRMAEESGLDPLEETDSIVPEKKAEEKEAPKKAKTTAKKTTPRKTTKKEPEKAPAEEEKKDEPVLEDELEKEEIAEENKEETEDEQAAEKPKEFVTGVLEVMPEGYGFLRLENYIQSNRDIYVPPQYIRRFNLRTGDMVNGPVRQQRDNDRYRALYYIKEVNGEAPEKMIRRPMFDRLTPIYPLERYKLETEREELSTRVIDLVCPIGKETRHDRLTSQSR